MLIEEGMPVREGDVAGPPRRLAAQRAVLRLAESQLEAARRALARDAARNWSWPELTLRRTERLVAEGVVGQADLDEARTAASTLRAPGWRCRKNRSGSPSGEVALRRTELEDTVIRAPFDGVVISKDAQPGEMVSPVSAGGGFTRTGICTVVDMGSLEIEVDVNESYISRVEAGQARRGGARRLPGLADPGARDHHDPGGRPAEGDGAGADRFRRAGPADPARHGRQGRLPRGRR